MSDIQQGDTLWSWWFYWSIGHGIGLERVVGRPWLRIAIAKAGGKE